MATACIDIIKCFTIKTLQYHTPYQGENSIKICIVGPEDPIKCCDNNNNEIAYFKKVESKMGNYASNYWGITCR